MSSAAEKAAARRAKILARGESRMAFVTGEAKTLDTSPLSPASSSDITSNESLALQNSENIPQNEAGASVPNEPSIFSPSSSSAFSPISQVSEPVNTSHSPSHSDEPEPPIKASEIQDVMETIHRISSAIDNNQSIPASSSSSLRHRSPAPSSPSSAPILPKKSPIVSSEQTKKQHEGWTSSKRRLLHLYFLILAAIFCAITTLRSPCDDISRIYSEASSVATNTNYQFFTQDYPISAVRNAIPQMSNCLVSSLDTSQLASLWTITSRISPTWLFLSLELASAFFIPILTGKSTTPIAKQEEEQPQPGKAEEKTAMISVVAAFIQANKMLTSARSIISDALIFLFTYVMIVSFPYFAGKVTAAFNNA